MTRLTGVETNLHRAGRLDLDHAQSVDRGEDRRETEPTSPFDDHGARGSGRGAHAPVEEGERRPRRTADDGPGPAAFGVASCELQRVDVVDERERERFTEFGRCRTTGVAVESSAHDESRATDHDRLDHRHDQQVE